MAYQLQLPTDAKLHPVFHVSQLKRSIGRVPSSPELPPQLSKELELLVEPEALLEVRQVRVRNALRLEVLIKWKHLPLFEATWEDAHMISNQFPTFHLEDKVTLWGGGIVMSPNESKSLKTYSRNKKKQEGTKVIAAAEVNDPVKGAEE